ncbi:MAG: ribonuclease HI family protein [Chloroflexota bacterium]|nr:ribonuclease HI family protein [Chloroflexota bacterium]
MEDVREIWKSIRALSDNDRRWLFAQLADWPPFQRLLSSRDGGAGKAWQPKVLFDGGSRVNPGPGYGSYALQFSDELPQVVHLEFGGRMTNNEAEYEALIHALEDLRGRLTALGADPQQCEVTVQGDSRLVINQVTGVWKAREPRMLQRRDRVRKIVRSFGSVSFEEKERGEIEEVLGH